MIEEHWIPYNYVSGTVAACVICENVININISLSAVWDGNPEQQSTACLYCAVVW